MKTKILITISLILFFGTIYSAKAQIKIGNNPTLIDSTSLLELESTNKGLLLPRMNSQEMNSMENPPNGMILFNKDSSSVVIRTNYQWRKLQFGIKDNSVSFKVGDNPTKIDSNALIELESHNKGLLLSRLNTTEMNSMENPPNGMIIYNIDSSSIVIRSNGEWRKLQLQTKTNTKFLKLGNNPAVKDSSSILELESLNKGLLLTRLNTPQMNQIPNPPNGLVIFNTDSSSIVIRTSGQWKKLQFGITNNTISKTYEDDLGYVFVQKYCTIGDGTFTNPWQSTDGSAGIKAALKQLTPTRRVLFFKSGYYATTGNQVIDFEKELPNLSDANWRVAFSGYGIEFQGHGASIYVNGGAPLLNGLPGIQFNWKNAHAFYWKFTGLQFYGVVNNPLVQWGNSYDFPLNGCEFDITANNGYIYPDYKLSMSPSAAIKICWPLESKLHLVAVSATGAGAILETPPFCTINGAFSNTIIDGSNKIYNNSFGLYLINAQSNNFTSMDLEVAFSGIKFDSWSIQNTFSAIFVSNCDSLGAVFDNSTQATNGKNLIMSIRNGPTIEEPSKPKVQKLYSTGSDATKIQIFNYFDF
jgi:hypothetical protein